MTQTRQNPWILTGFLLFSSLFRADYFCRFRLTQTVTHTGSRSGQDWKLPERTLPMVLAAWRWEAVVTWA